jgi:hypothetical protein
MKRHLLRFLWAACDVGLGRSYGHTGEETQDCIRFQVAVLVPLYPEVDFTPHLDLLHLNGQPVGSLANMQKLVDLGVGVEVDDAIEPGIYCLQGWNGGRGHAIFMIRRGGGGLFVMDFTTATTDGLRPLDWVDVLRKWPTRMIVKLREP